MSRHPSNTNDQAPELNVRHCDRELSLGVLDRFVMMAWRHSSNGAAMFPAMRAIHELRSERPQVRLVLLSLVEPDCEVPASPDVARSWSDVLKRHEGAIVGTAVVYNRDGFWSAVMRSQVMAIHTESKAGIPHFVSPSVEAACGWLAALLDAPPPLSLLVEAAERLRATRIALASG